MTTKERPILFSGPMVRAILAGQKTQTRRVMKPQPEPCPADHTRAGHWWPSRPHQSMLHVEDELQKWTGLAGDACPIGDHGERLWVRETWADVNLYGAPAIAYRADHHLSDLMSDQSFLDEGAFNYEDPRYRAVAAGKQGNQFSVWAFDLLNETEGRWRSAMFMPRWVCRLVLEIVSVRVERLQAISTEDCVAEGLSTNLREQEAVDDLRGQWKDLWTGINGAASWEANPWVWVVEFKRVEAAA
jgi:hypothetical protein